MELSHVESNQYSCKFLMLLENGILFIYNGLVRLILAWDFHLKRLCHGDFMFFGQTSAFAHAWKQYKILQKHQRE